MMPNIDARTMKNMMAKMGISSTEINATRVVIELPDREILVESPQVTRIEAQGSVSFQISGTITEMERNVKLDVTEDDVKLVSESTGITDETVVRKALEDAQGNIAKAILELEKHEQSK
ncbi:MAG TPA: nascent polypeptide-associated complex protein [Candidatus Acidoferrales bacterium]|nr:nascent polypeptide-associated complex protein [Candidatus Acidoferrales bacterium]